MAREQIDSDDDDDDYDDYDDDDDDDDADDDDDDDADDDDDDDDDGLHLLCKWMDLIMSDGSDKLFFRNPATFELTRVLNVVDPTNRQVKHELSVKTGE
eukprot:763346-Hanusia_phi.AAC.3